MSARCSKLPIFTSSRLGLPAAVLAALLLLAGSRGARAADGDLDPAFGAGGRVQTDFGSTTDYGYGVAIQSDGRIVVVGQTGNDFALARYNTGGSLDATFGLGGKVATDFSGGMDSGRGVAIQSDGKIVVAGYTTSSFALARYNSDGSLDATFGAGGKVATAFFGLLDKAFAVALQSDGKIVAAGFAYDLTGHSNFALARYNPDGSLDTGFGTGGKFTFQFTGISDAADAVAIQPDGAILAGGRAGNQWGVIRVKADGSALDATFNGAGYVTPIFSGNANTAGAGELLVQPDGAVVGVGVTIGASADLAVARFTPAGALDVSAFGAPLGEVTKDFTGGADSGQSGALQGDGKIIAAGIATVAGHGDFALARFNTDGTPDASFHGGSVTTDFAGLDDAANAVAIQSDGRIVAAGTATTAAGTDFAVARYLAGSATAGATPLSAEGVSLAPAYPNPARAGVSIDFVLPQEGTASLVVYDVTGRPIRTLVSGRLTAGPHSARWDGRAASGTPASSGLYFYELRAGARALTRRVALIR